MKGYRTILFNIVATIPLLIAAITPDLISLAAMPEMLSLIPEGWQKWYAIALAVCNIYLRSITTTPVGKA
jgi:hypothetical protein